MTLTFLGAAGTVTGSKYFIQWQGLNLLVDCGLFQGHKSLRELNWRPFPIPPHQIDAVLLTHAHLDHSGYLPLLVKQGFSGPIYASEATIDLCRILLPDSGYIQEEDAERANRYGYTKHRPAKPLYTQQDAERSLQYFEPVAFNQTVSLKNGATACFHRAGHILGAAMVMLTHPQGTKILFSGDLGRLEDPVMSPPVPIETADYLVIESTYGDSFHEKSDVMMRLDTCINNTIRHNGTVVIPAFAVGRAQSLLYYLYKLKQQNRLPQHLPIYLDSPMAIDATRLIQQHRQDHHLNKEDIQGTCSVATYVNTAEESKRINTLSMPSVIISASGMATGGRVLHHLKQYAPHSRNTLLFTGFQAGGTRGDRILKGETQVKIHGEFVPIRAKVELIGNLSAHADQEEILTWMSHFQSPPRQVFITHGEPEASSALKAAITEKFGWPCSQPELFDVTKLV